MKQVIITLMLSLFLVQFQGLSYADSLPVPAPDPDSLFGVDLNINVSTLDSYLGRDDVVYCDVRMLFDPADFSVIGGNADLATTVEGFRIIPYPYLATLPELPVDGAYKGNTLFTLTWNQDGTIASATVNYEESMLILNDLFPRNKSIFLMCGDGGYAGMTKSLLVFLGWDPGLIYNLGGNWYYDGTHSVELIHYGELIGDADYYYTWRADYTWIDFSLLHPVIS